MYDSYNSTLRSYISMQPVQTDKPVARAPLTRPQRQQLNNNINIFKHPNEKRQKNPIVEKHDVNLWLSDFICSNPDKFCVNEEFFN